MRREDDAGRGLLEQLGQIALAVVPANHGDQLGDAAGTGQVVHLRERSILERVEEDNLALDELQKQEQCLVLRDVGSTGGFLREEARDDGPGGFLERQGLTAVLGEDGQEPADPLEKLVRQPQEQAGVQSIASGDVLVRRRARARGTMSCLEL